VLLPLPCMLPPSLFQVGLWGAETGDEMGSGETYDGNICEQYSM
jgi:hypothetical protein